MRRLLLTTAALLPAFAEEATGRAVTGRSDTLRHEGMLAQPVSVGLQVR